jgi:fumarate hydratase subunit alpha
MRVISASKISSTVADLCIRANHLLRDDVLKVLRKTELKEKSSRAKRMIAAVIKNADIARREKLAVCQDTGIPIVFLELGQDVRIKGDLLLAVQQGISLGYKKGCLRNSIVRDPFARGSSDFSPGVLHTEMVKGNKLKITILPKGFGCENKSQVKMFNPTVRLEEIKRFIVEAVRTAGPDACPPYVVGVGIGGSADYSAILAKKALLRKIPSHHPKYALIEKELLKRINRLNIGPMGLGGIATCLAVNIETHATHIAGLPVAVNISCHALRSASTIL